MRAFVSNSREMHFETSLSKFSFLYLDARGYLRYTAFDAPQEYSIPSPAYSAWYFVVMEASMPRLSQMNSNCDFSFAKSVGAAAHQHRDGPSRVEVTLPLYTSRRVSSRGASKKGHLPRPYPSKRRAPVHRLRSGESYDSQSSSCSSHRTRRV